MEMDSQTDTDRAAAAEQPAEVDVEAILGGLDTHQFTRLPEEAIRQCQQHRELMTPHLIRQIELATEQIRKGEELVGDAHWIALYLLWEFQAKEALPAILAALKLPGDGAYDLFSDGVSEDVPQVLAALAGDERDLIDTLIGNVELDEFVRWAAASSYAYLVRDGNMPREEAVDRLWHHLRSAIDSNRHEDTFLILELCKFNPQIAVADIWRAYDRGIVDEGMADRAYVEGQLAAGEQTSQREFGWLEPTQLADTIEHFREWHCFRPRSEPAFESPTARQQFEQQWQAAKRDALHGEDLDEEPVYTESATIRNDGPRIGRNDPCPCGSGKKYKKCCLRRESIF